MVEFGEYLLSLRNPEWASQYLNYELLKVLLYNIRNACARIEHQKEATTSQSPGETTSNTTLASPSPSTSTSSPSLPAKQCDLPEGHAFEEQLDKELDKINGFYLRKKLELGRRLEQLQERVKNHSIPDQQPQLKEELRMLFQTLNVDFHLLRDFSSLNYTGFSKILKKHDKVCPRYKMKVNYIRHHVNRQPVFGILDELYRYQTLTQQLYADVFNSGNRIEAEMELESSFTKVFEQKRRRGMDGQSSFKRGKSSRTLSSYTTDTDSIIIPRKSIEKETTSPAQFLWQKARLTWMNTTSFDSQEAITIILSSLFLIFFGGCAQSLSLEYIVVRDPGCGSAITFFQFLFVALEGLSNYILIDEKKPSNAGLFGIFRRLHLKPRQIPLKYHIACVTLSWLSAVLAASAYNYKISVPLHMIVKSSILVVNMGIGVILLRKRYTMGEVFSVFVLTAGVIVSTLVSLPKEATGTGVGAQANFTTWLIGLAILCLSILCTGLLGVLQDFSYRSYGKHWEEIMFYAHFLGLALFTTVAGDIWRHVSVWPIEMWGFLLFNALTSFVAIRGTYQLISVTSSLTGTLTITVRKFFVLVLSVLLFKNDFTFIHWLGATLVLVGSILYTVYSSRASHAAAVKAKEEKAANKKRD